MASYNFSTPLSAFTEMFINPPVSFSSSSVSIFCSKSNLLTSTIDFLFSVNFISSLSSSVNSLEPSNIRSTKSASIARVFDFSTPICSITLSVSLIPAVSIILRGIPPTFIISSSTSLVVPAISVTMALSSSKRVFKSDDLPTFGLPKITVLMPSLYIFPVSAVAISLFTSTNISLAPLSTAS